MHVLELSYHAGDSDRSPSAHVVVDGKEYLILGGRKSVTVVVGRWIKDRRSVGKTFWSPSELAANYKRHGEALLEYANRLTRWSN